eukprot:13722629-Alexandrium_andersonii.AAC.1
MALSAARNLQDIGNPNAPYTNGCLPLPRGGRGPRGELPGCPGRALPDPLPLHSAVALCTKPNVQTVGWQLRFC